jgi:hypothetical protein
MDMYEAAGREHARTAGPIALLLLFVAQRL